MCVIRAGWFRFAASRVGTEAKDRGLTRVDDWHCVYHAGNIRLMVSSQTCDSPRSTRNAKTNYIPNFDQWNCSMSAALSGLARLVCGSFYLHWQLGMRIQLFTEVDCRRLRRIVTRQFQIEMKFLGKVLNDYGNALECKVAIFELSTKALVIMCMHNVCILLSAVVSTGETNLQSSRPFAVMMCAFRA